MTVRRLILLVFCLLLSGCASGTLAVPEPRLPGVGGTTPQDAVQSFFDSLNSALNDPALDDDEARKRWADQLAGYFAPDERIEQRIAMGRMLDAVAASRSQALAEAQDGEQLQVLLEIRPQPVGVQTRTQQRSRAEVQIVSGELHLKVSRLRDNNAEPISEQSEPLAKLIGRAEGSVPLVRVDGRWFLSST